jgi:ring-1,2-phenylacetyl-CoA epoxidase subunit PaaC
MTAVASTVAASSASITISSDPALQYVLRLADLCLIHAQRLSEWCGHAPVLEEDIALTNLSLDLIGQARALYSHAGQIDGSGRDEDQYAFLRDERDYRNPTLVELPLRRAISGPAGDFADTVLRNLVVATLLKQVWEALSGPGGSNDAELAAIAGKALKEARYHQRHSADWVVRLGDGTEESARRMQAAVNRLWPYIAELFAADAVDDAAATSGLGPRMADLRPAWEAEMNAVFTEAQLRVPAPTAFRSSGRQGVHSEHMGYLLAEMQHLQRAFPGGVW